MPGPRKDALPPPPMIEINTSVEGNIKVISVAGKLGPLDGKELRGVMQSSVDGKDAAHLVVDLEKLEYMASAGFRELFFIGKQLERAGGKLVVCSLQGEVQRIFVLARFDSAYPIFATRQEALDYLNGQ